MTVTKDTLLHLNRTLYWDDDGCPRDSLEEAKNNSLFSDSYTKVGKQNCYFYEYNDLSEEEKENAQSIADSYFGCKPEELMYIVNARTKRILFATFWDQTQKDLVDGLYSII